MGMMEHYSENCTKCFGDFVGCLVKNCDTEC